MFRHLVLFIAVLALSALPASAEWTPRTLIDVPNGAGYVWAYGMSYDGNRVLFISDTDGKSSWWDHEVFLLDLTSGATFQITRNIGLEAYAGISGDGRTIVYGTEQTVNGERRFEFYKVEESNSWQNPVDLGIHESWPDHCPLTERPVLVSYDGSFIKVMKPDYGSDEIYEPDGYVFTMGNVREFSIEYPDLSGDYLVWYDVHGVLARKNIKTGEYTEIFTHPLILGFSVASDGRVAFSISSLQDRHGIFLYDNGNIDRLSERMPDYIPPLRLSKDGSTLVYVDDGTLYAMDVRSRNEEVVATRVPSYSFIFVNEDGSRILLTAYNDSDNSWEIKLYQKSSRKITGVQQNFLPGLGKFGNMVIGVKQLAIEYNSGQGCRGCDVDIPVEIVNADEVGAVGLTLSYPDDVLEVTDVVTGSMTENSMLEYNVESGKIKIGIVSSDGITGSGTLVHLKFRVLEGITDPFEAVERVELYKQNPALAERRYQQVYSLDVLKAEVRDIGGNLMQPLLINGTFRVVSEQSVTARGDVNGDGEVTSVDALIALKMSVGIVDPEPVADVNGDGDVTVGDALEILRMSNLYEIFVVGRGGTEEKTTLPFTGKKK